MSTNDLNESYELMEEAKRVVSKEDFLLFLDGLLQEYNEEGSQWENSDLGSYLEGIGSYIFGLEEFDDENNMKNINTPTWKLFAMILIRATSWE